MLTFYLSNREVKYANQIRPNHRMLNKSNSNFKSCLKQNSKCSEKYMYLENPHMENCSQYSGSTIHTCMKVDPPIHRTATKVYFQHQSKINPFNVYFLFLKAIDL